MVETLKCDYWLEIFLCPRWKRRLLECIFILDFQTTLVRANRKQALEAGGCVWGTEETGETGETIPHSFHSILFSPPYQEILAFRMGKTGETRGDRGDRGHRGQMGHRGRLLRSTLFRILTIIGGCLWHRFCPVCCYWILGKPTLLWMHNVNAIHYS